MLKWIGLLLLLVLIGSGAYVYTQVYVSMGQKKEVEIVVKTGQASTEIAKTIESAGGPSYTSLVLARGILGSVDVQPGAYKLNSPISASQAWSELGKQSADLKEKAKKSVTREVVTVTIREGLTIDQMLSVFQASKLVNKDELSSYWTPYNSSLKQAFSFLPEKRSCTYGDITQCIKYYLEGYLYPDTYQFFIDETVEGITKKMLANFESKHKENIKQTESTEELFNSIIIASLVEKEAGRPAGNTNDPKLVEERKLIASVFVNRKEQGIKMQSDPTVTYGTGATLCQQFDPKPGCKFLDDPIFTSSLYDTYVQKGLPIGPISTPTVASLTAVLNPVSTEYIFFVNDIEGKAYFATTNAEHEKNIANLERINNNLRIKEAEQNR